MANHLDREASPYLKMHADNPVDWYPWGPEALQKAKDENKPILLSIGYTACHWCHVMAHESFEDQTTAEIMNRYFINVKVDREERPDLDKIYQLSAQLLTQKVGGWPLTVFLMPQNQVPFFAGTYFPTVRRGNYPAFQEVLQYVNMIYTEHQEELQKQNISFKNILSELSAQAQESASLLTHQPIKEGQTLLVQSFDKENGGFGTAPKFPMTAALERFLLDGDVDSQNKLKFTLQKMTTGGIYDHLGGGFFRYTVDQQWQIPHFEKMLYDNALLLPLLLQANSLLNLPFLSEYIAGTANWLLREMTDEEGGFYATLSADTEGKEGLYYIWTREEIKNILSPEEYTVINIYYGLERHPNFDHHWHLNIISSVEQIANALQIDQSNVQNLLIAANKKLFLARNKRAYPQRDEKIIVGWNGLTMKALAIAGLYLEEEKYISAAQKALDFIRDNLWENGKLYSVYKDAYITKSATLDDYVFLIEGIFYLLQARWRSQDCDFLIDLVSVSRQQFEDQAVGGFYFTPNDHETLIYRMKQYADESIPSSNGVYTRILEQIGYFLGDAILLDSAEKSLKNAFPHVTKHPDFYCSFLTALQFHYQPSQIIIIRGNDNDFSNWQTVLIGNPHPNRFAFLIAQDQPLPSFLEMKKSHPDGTVAYICQGSQCYEPILTIEDFEYELRRLTKSSG